MSRNTSAAVARALESIKKIGFKGIEENETILNDALEHGATIQEQSSPPDDPIISNLLSITDQRVSDILRLTYATDRANIPRYHQSTVSDVLTGSMTPHEALRSMIRLMASLLSLIG